MHIYIEALACRTFNCFEATFTRVFVVAWALTALTEVLDLLGTDSAAISIASLSP